MAFGITKIMVNPIIFLPVAFALGMSTVGVIYVLSGRWWPPYLAKRLARLTEPQSTVRAYGVIALGIVIGVACLLLLSLRR